MENDNFLSPKNPLKTIEDSSSRCADDNGDHGGPAGSKKLRRKSISGSKNFLVFRKNVVSENKQRLKMKDKYSASSSRSSSSMTRRTGPSIPLVPAPPGGGSRRFSFLERSLFPGIKPDAVIPIPSTTEEQLKTSQLTIFYAGVINVYDDVPVNQAQAVMLLASQSSSSHPAIKDIAKADLVVKPVPRSQSPSLYKTREDDLHLPIARRQSLRRFLDKRRDRIMNKHSIP